MSVSNATNPKSSDAEFPLTTHAEGCGVRRFDIRCMSSERGGLPTQHWKYLDEWDDLQAGSHSQVLSGIGRSD